MTYLITELKRAVLLALPAFALVAAATATAMAGNSPATRRGRCRFSAETRQRRTSSAR